MLLLTHSGSINLSLGLFSECESLIKVYVDIWHHVASQSTFLSSFVGGFLA